MKKYTIVLYLLMEMTVALAHIPQLINYQGNLVNREGQPLSGRYEIELRLYDQETSGSPLWSEKQMVEVTYGYFNVLLGSVNKLTPGLFCKSDRFLTIIVGTDPDMCPRTKLTSVAYAFRSSNTDSIDGKCSDDFVKNGQKNAITHEMIQENIVSSINHVIHDGGNIDLMAGDNIKITPDAAQKNIIISADLSTIGDNLGDHTARQNIKTNENWISNNGKDEGIFIGYVDIQGTLQKSAGSFKIDHPQDPENMYLQHSFVESPDMKNVYDGNVILDGCGEASVELPDYFESLNIDFRYQLTAIGAPGPNLFIAEKICNNRFKIAGGEPGMEVSWQITGIRNDAYARVITGLKLRSRKKEKSRVNTFFPKSITARNLGVFNMNSSKRKMI
ncbi:MAG: hypothetical protein JXQ65_07240 [Candidatus Marinimicrobia bacterium]|nr:hypothetical protein [Candidatus Neomarinimicrobiota bacterium]